jgi:hypothetical protein
MAGHFPHQCETGGSREVGKRAGRKERRAIVVEDSGFDTNAAAILGGIDLRRASLILKEILRGSRMAERSDSGTTP